MSGSISDCVNLSANSFLTRTSPWFTVWVYTQRSHTHTLDRLSSFFYFPIVLFSDYCVITRVHQTSILLPNRMSLSLCLWWLVFVSNDTTTQLYLMTVLCRWDSELLRPLSIHSQDKWWLRPVDSLNTTSRINEYYCPCFIVLYWLIDRCVYWHSNI